MRSARESGLLLLRKRCKRTFSTPERMMTSDPEMEDLQSPIMDETFKSLEAEATKRMREPGCRKEEMAPSLSR